MSNVETWEKATDASTWIVSLDAKGNETPRRINGPAGTRFKVKDTERETFSESYFDPTQDAFRNGVFLPVTLTPEQAAEEIPGFDADQAKSDEDLVALFASSGAAFQAKVSKLSEVNQRRMAALGEAQPDIVSNAQSNFLEKVLAQYNPTFKFEAVGDVG